MANKCHIYLGTVNLWLLTGAVLGGAEGSHGY
ncbi:MAG: hypothetical protein ACI9ME_000302 [Ilumatobacter sp.]|jgi:hypothetical protein